MTRIASSRRSRRSSAWERLLKSLPRTLPIARRSRPWWAISARAGRPCGALSMQPPPGAGGPWSKCPGRRSKACCAAKTIGTWNLHELTRDCSLDFFALFSSTASLLGGQKLAHYAAANAFLDAFAQYRRFLGLPVVSINWGTWDELRQFSRAEQNGARNVSASSRCPSEQRFPAFGRLLAAGDTQKVVAAVDWTAALAGSLRQSESAVFSSGSSGGPRRLDQRSPRAPRNSCSGSRLLPRSGDSKCSKIRCSSEVARVLGRDPAQAIDPRQGFFEMGMDSLTSIQLRRALEAAVERPLPATLTFNFPTIATLTAFLANELFSATPGPGSVPANDPDHGALSLSDHQALQRSTRCSSGCATWKRSVANQSP